MVADKLPAVGIFSIAGGFVAVPAIAVLVLLGVTAIDVGGPMVAHSYYCSGAAPLFVALESALGAVVASASRLFLELLGPRTPFETAVHSPQLVGLHFGLLPPHCPLFLVASPQSILPSPAEGLLGCERGPVALQFLCLLSGGVLLRLIIFAGGGTSCNLPFASPIPCSLGGITLTFVDLDMRSPWILCLL